MPPSPTWQKPMPPLNPFLPITLIYYPGILHMVHWYQHSHHNHPKNIWKRSNSTNRISKHTSSPHPRHQTNPLVTSPNVYGFTLSLLLFQWYVILFYSVQLEKIYTILVTDDVKLVWIIRFLISTGFGPFWPILHIIVLVFEHFWNDLVHGWHQIWRCWESHPIGICDSLK